jgi:hypothetical protein
LQPSLRKDLQKNSRAAEEWLLIHQCSIGTGSLWDCNVFLIEKVQEVISKEADSDGKGLGMRIIPLILSDSRELFVLFEANVYCSMLRLVLDNSGCMDLRIH